jgi:hypothetical protein
MQMHPVSLRRARWLVLHALAVSTSFAQGRPLQPSPEPPPEDARALQRMNAPTLPLDAGAPTVDALLRQLGVTRAEIARRQRARTTRPLPSSAQEPPDVAAERRFPRPPAVRDSGRPEASGDATAPRRLGPFVPPVVRDEFAEAAASGKVAEPTMRVTRADPYQALTGVGSLRGTAYFPYTANSDLYWGWLARATTASTNTAVGGPYDVRPYLRVSLKVDVAGWYVINVRANPTRAELRHYVSGTYNLLQTFALPAEVASNHNSYPVLVELAAGWHYFYWAPLDACWVAEVVVIKL